MKDFCKWLGCNEKIAKIVFYLFVFMAFLVMTNAMLESIGLPYYKVTIENLSKINYSKVLDYILSWILTLMNFYSLVFVIFDLKSFKKIFKWSMLYLILNIIILNVFGNMVLQIFILIFVIGFAYFYSNKNKKYILYGFGTYALNAIVQFICYSFKIKLIDYPSLNQLNILLLSFDYLIVMAIMIFIKEIVKRKKGEKE